MSPFEFVFALVSVITSLAITHMIGGVVELIRSPRPGRIGLVHGLWIYFAFVLVIGNWAALWLTRDRDDWSPSLIAAHIATMITLYAFAALVLPSNEDRADISDFHEREGRRYMIAHLVFTLIAIGLAFVRWEATGEALELRIPALIAVVLGVIGLTVRARAVQLAVAIALVLLVTYFTATNLHIVG